jgi:hypothetical protein
MTAKELISTFRILGPQEASVIFTYLADQVYDAKLATGQRILDATDFTAWLRELAEAAKVSDFSQSTQVSSGTEFGTSPKVMPRPPQPRWDRSCPDCGHEHEGRNDCAKSLGEGKFCQCESRVSA